MSLTQESVSVRTFSVCGTFVHTKGTAPASSNMSTRTAFFSALMPTQETYPRNVIRIDCAIEIIGITHDSVHSLDAELILCSIRT